MSYVQALTPTPTVACTPGWCLKYVSDAFGVSSVPHTTYPSATAAWNSSRQHQDQSFPAGLWVPVWFSLRDEPAGHVALRAPDGSIWSSSDPNTSVPHHHPSLAALINYYANANPLTYLGWTEDIGGTAVIKEEFMPDKVNLDTARILAYQCLARDGEDGRPNAHKGECDDDLIKHHVGQDLTNQYIRDNFFLSPEASNAFAIKGAVYAVRDAEKGQVATLTGQIAAEQVKSTGLAKNLNDSQLDLKDAKDQLAQAESLASDDDAKIKDLTTQLATAQANIDQLKTQADKPPAAIEVTQVPSAPQAPRSQTQTYSSFWDALVSFIKATRK